MNRKRIVYALLTGGMVAIVFLFVTVAHFRMRDQAYDATLWRETALIGAAFFVIVALGALVSSFTSRMAFSELSRRGVAIASVIAAAVTSTLFNAEFPASPVPDWLEGLAILLAPVLVSTGSILAANRLQLPNKRLQMTRSTQRTPEK